MTVRTTVSQYPSFSEDGSPYSSMLYNRELHSHVIMQRDVGTEICGVFPRKKPVDVATRWVKNSDENLDEDSPYVLVNDEIGDS